MNGSTVQTNRFIVFILPGINLDRDKIIYFVVHAWFRYCPTFLTMMRLPFVHSDYTGEIHVVIKLLHNVIGISDDQKKIISYINNEL